MDDKPVFRREFAFSYKTIWNHLYCFTKRPLPILVVTAAIFGAFMTFSEATILFTDAMPRGWGTYGALFGVSLFISLFWNAYQYLHYIPEGFENVSAYAQRLAHLQRPLWEFRLAKTLLAQRLAPLERELRDMEAGRLFVIAKKPKNLRSYIRWSNARIENLVNMLSVAQQLLLNDFPAALQSTIDKHANPKTILGAVETLARFYGETVKFERSSRAVMPSENLRKLHQHQLGWSEPIRDGVRQLFQFLQQMCECNPDGDNHISFTIVFDEPPGCSQFREELIRLKDHIPSLESNW